LLSIDGALTDAATETVVRSIVEAGDATGRALFEAVAARDRTAAEALSIYLVDGLDPSEALERFPETLGRLMQFGLRREVLRLQSEMRDAESSRDSALYDELFRRAAEVQRRLSELRSVDPVGY